MMKRLFLIFCFFSFSVFAEADYSGQLSDIQSILFGINGQVDGFQISTDNYLQQFSDLLTDIHNSQPDSSYLDSYRTYLKNLSERFGSFKDDYSNFLTEFNNLRYDCLEFIETDVGLAKDFIDDIRTSYLSPLLDNSSSIVSSLGDSIGSDVSEIRTDLESLRPIVDFYSDTSKLYDDTEWKVLRDYLFEKSMSSPGYNTSFYYFDGAKRTLKRTFNVNSRKGFFDSLDIYLRCFNDGLSSISYSSVYPALALKPLLNNNSVNNSFLYESDFSHSYATIEFESNSVPSQVDLTYSGMDFFNASIKLLSDGNKINGAATMFLKHIRERLPDLSTKDTSEDEERISQQLDDAGNRFDSLRQSFEFSDIKFKENVDDYFDGDQILREFSSSSYCPSAINIRIPDFFDMPEQVVVVLTSDIAPFLDVTRACFDIFYYVVLGGFIFFAFRFFLPFVSRFSKLLATVLNW